MDEMQQVAADKLALDAAQRKAAVSARALAEATAYREALGEERATKARALAQVEADKLAALEAARAAEEAEVAAEDAKRKAYEDALGTEADAADQADADAAEVQRLSEVNTRNQARAEIPKLEQAVADRERLQGVDHPDTVAARDELERARDAVKPNSDQPGPNRKF
jgi:dTMP kinase